MRKRDSASLPFSLSSTCSASCLQLLGAERRLVLQQRRSMVLESRRRLSRELLCAASFSPFTFTFGFARAQYDLFRVFTATLAWAQYMSQQYSRKLINTWRYAYEALV